MTLPYPPEYEEEGKLHPPARGPRTTVDVRAAVEHMVQPCAGGLSIVGRELAAPAAASAEDDLLSAYRVAIAERLLDRWPNATMDTVRRLEEVLAAELGTHALADRETLETILETIDGL